MVFGGPRERFSERDIENLKEYVNNGGSALFLAGEGGETALGTNLNAVRAMPYGCHAGPPTPACTGTGTNTNRNQQHYQRYQRYPCCCHHRRHGRRQDARHRLTPPPTRPIAR